MECRVLIVGGGSTGAGLARDLALRGVSSLLVERTDVNSGASGSNHGLLHSGARYIGSDPAAAGECCEEGEILKRLAPECIEQTGGLFVAVQGDDENYIADFPAACARYGIPTEPVDLREAREIEPALAENLIAAYSVRDATIDPFRLSFNNLAQARGLGSEVMLYSRVISMEVSGGRIVAVRVRNMETGRETAVRPEIVVNAAGAWAGRIAAMVGVKIHIIFSKGTLLITPRRMSRRVINRLRRASDSDILVPGGTVSILGTTSIRVEDPDDIYPEIHEIDEIIREGARMVPALDATRFIRAYCGIRPLVHTGDGDEDDREVSRGYSLVDHAREGVSNFVTITGGKLTTYRLMAEKTADLVCRKLGVAEPCRTRTEPLSDAEEARWTEPGLAAKKAILKSDPADLMVCDCEMVPRSTVDDLIEAVLAQKDEVGMIDVGQRSRLGKGSCQGTFCSQRLIAHLYDREIYNGRAGMAEIKTFVQERWRGRQPVLWDTPMIQADLQEAIQCGLLGLELVGDERPRAEDSASPDEAPAEIPKRAAIGEAETCPKR